MVDGIYGYLLETYPIYLLVVAQSRKDWQTQNRESVPSVKLQKKG